MDTVIYWIGMVVRILLGLVFLRVCVWSMFWLVERVWGVAISASGWWFGRLESVTLKTQNLEVQVNGIFLTVHWLDPTCRHFLKVNVCGVHAEYLLSEDGASKRTVAVKTTKTMDSPPLLAPTRKKRLAYWCFCKIIKLLELSVKCLEVCVYDAIGPDTSLVTMFQVNGHVNVIAQPLPTKELAVSLEIEKAIGQLFLHGDKPCPTTEDGMYPLAELSLSTKVLLFLNPLNTRGRVLNSVQINTAPLSLTLMQEDAIEYAAQHLRKRMKSGSNAGPSGAALSKLPDKLEIVLEDVTLRYHANSSTRSLSSKITRVSIAATLTPSKPENKNILPIFCVTAGLQELIVKDPLSHKILKLHQLRVVSEHSSDTLSNSVQVDSVHVSIWEGETVFWAQYILDTINTYRTKAKLKQKTKKTLPANQRIYSFLNHLFVLPVSMVTTMELSDWSIQLRLDAETLQSKEPVCRFVVASCAASVQWGALEEDTTTVRASVRLEDSYLHVPGFHPTINNSAYYQQHVDNPAVLPSLRKHLWGRAVSLGSLMLKAEKDIGVKSEGSAGTREAIFLNEPLRVSGEGHSLMLEWSKPTAVTLLRSLEHVKQKYNLFSGPSRTLGRDKAKLNVSSEQTDASGDSIGGGADSHDSGSVWERLSLQGMDTRFQLMDVNAFVYGLTPEPPAVMVRLDAASLSSLHPPSFQLDLHGLLMDSMTLQSPEPAFLCSPIASLPEGVGVAVLTTMGVKYDSTMKELGATVAKLTVDWNTTAHRSVFHTGCCIWENCQKVKDLFLSPPPSSSSSSSSSSSAHEREGDVTSLGELGKAALTRVPVSVVVSLETAECRAKVDRRAKISLSLLTSKCQISGSSLVTSIREVGVNFDQHRIITLEQMVGRFPHSSEQLLAQRKKVVGDRLTRKENPIVGLQANRVELMFPYKYNFAFAFDKVMNVKKFLQKVHSGSGDPNSPRPLLLFPDVFMEVGDIVWQLCDDPFEVKLRANYELMCDESEQKSQRYQALEQKLEDFKREKGEILSAKKVQGLYDSLDAKDSEIYCKRVQEMYGSEPLRTNLFVFSMHQTNLLAMFDPSMLGEKNLVAQLKEVDDISPFPEEPYSFSTLWGMYVSGDTQKLQMQLRDYPEPLLAMTEVTISGRILFAEQEAQERERRLAVVEVGRPWGNTTVCRKLPPLKYYYDFEMGAVTFELSYGPCLEPALAETSLGFNFLTSPSIDPSAPLPYWDKLRLLFHGRIHLVTKEMTIILPASTNPYNNVEFLELRLGDLDARLLTNTRLDLEGSLQLIVHTASKYDECEIFNFPLAHSSLLCKWDCGGRDPNNHHAVVRCAPDKLPLRHDKQEHDSYGAFRSQNLDLEWSLDVQPQRERDEYPPSVLLYASTLRCLQQYQTLVSSNVTRPIKRGEYFKNPKRKRPPLIRHWRDVKVSVNIPNSLLQYWSSVARQQGMECRVDKGEFSIHYRLTLTPVEDGLKHRPRANWTICSCEGRMDKLTVWVQRRVEPTEHKEDQQGLDVVEEEEEEEEEKEWEEHSKCILLSMAELTYKRQEISSTTSTNDHENFKHLLKTLNTCMLWSASNRKVVMGLYDAYKQAQSLKRDLSTEALKSILMKLEAPGKDSPPDQPPSPLVAAVSEAVGSHRPSEHSPSHPHLQRHSSSGSVMLDQLLSDIQNKFVTYAEERQQSDPNLRGIKAGSRNDVTQRNWLVELTNTQIALQGIEHHGFVLASSSIAQVFGCDHEPRLREGDLVTKKSLICKVLDMQYFATFGSSLDPDYIPWLPLSVICPPDIGTHEPSSEVAPHDEESSLNALLSELGPKSDNRETTPPGEAVGGVVSCLLVARDDLSMGGGEKSSRQTVQLQRIASRCHCQIFYVTYGGQAEAEDCKTPPTILSPKGNASSGLYDSSNEAVNTFTFRYPTVEVCTTSTQYVLIMDILNNLLLHKEPRKKEALVKHSRMQFTLQLSNIQDPRKVVLVQQNKVRKCLQTIRELETQLFLEQKSSDSSPETQLELEKNLSTAKEELSTASMKLRAMIRAFKESLIYRTPPSGTEHTEVPEPVRRIEVWLDDAHWSLTQEDGQLQVADICLTNFSYNRVSFSDDSGEHRLELGTFKVLNRMPNTPQLYQQVLMPYDPKSRHLRVDKNICLRVYCRDKAPVAGIAVIEHLEFNVVPLAVSLTSKFYQTMQDFFFPKAEGEGQGEGTDPDHAHLFGPGGVQPTPSSGDSPDSNSPFLSRASSVRRSTLSVTSATTTASSTSGTLTSSPPTSPSPKEVRKGRHHTAKRVDDVEKMRERASHIKTFIYVKIPQTSLCITYKSESVSFKDLQRQLVTVQTLEYHNKNWTWTNMLMEVKKDYKNAIVHQTLKSAIGMKESEETAGLASPKLTRHHASDMLLGKAKKGSMQTKGRKLLGKLGGSREEGSTERGERADSVSFSPMESEDIKKTYKKLTRLSQEAQK